MSVSQHEIDSFHNFVSAVLPSCGRDESMESLLNQWRSQHEEAETLSSVRRGVEDSEAGRVQSLKEVDAKIRTELGFPARSQ